MTLRTEPASYSAPATERAPALSVWLFVALAVAVAGLAGSLYLSLGMHLKACPLCFYQRTFMMSVVAVLVVGLLGGLGPSGRLGLLALPLAVGGLGVAAFHVYLEAVGTMECPKGIADLGSAPQQSLVVFVALTAILLTESIASWRAGRGRWLLMAGGVILGVALGYASSISNPPMPAPPEKPYAGPPDICRPPYQPRVAGHR